MWTNGKINCFFILTRANFLISLDLAVKML